MLLVLFAVACLVFAVAYKFYGDFQSRVYGLDDKNPTPAQTLSDGMDYVPAHPAVLLGHHFASIAGAGPVVGPIAAAAMFGWLPAYLWILVGYTIWAQSLLPLDIEVCLLVKLSING